MWSAAAAFDLSSLDQIVLAYQIRKARNTFHSASHADDIGHSVHAA